MMNRQAIYGDNEYQNEDDDMNAYNQFSQQPYLYRQ